MLVLIGRFPLESNRRIAVQVEQENECPEYPIEIGTIKDKMGRC